MLQLVRPFVPPPAPSDEESHSFPQLRDGLLNHLRLFEALLTQHLTLVANQLNTAGQGAGADLDSTSGVLSPSAYIHLVTGAGTVTRINPPPNYAGGALILVARDGFSIATGGNIASAKTLLAGQGVVLNYHLNQKLWYVVSTVTDQNDVPDSPVYSRFLGSNMDNPTTTRRVSYQGYSPGSFENFLGLMPSGNAFPVTPAAGQMFYRSDQDRYYIFTATGSTPGWVQVSLGSLAEMKDDPAGVWNKLGAVESGSNLATTTSLKPSSVTKTSQSPVGAGTLIKNTYLQVLSLAFTPLAATDLVTLSVTGLTAKGVDSAAFQSNSSSTTVLFPAVNVPTGGGFTGLVIAVELTSGLSITWGTGETGKLALQDAGVGDLFAATISPTSGSFTPAAATLSVAAASWSATLICQGAGYVANATALATASPLTIATPVSAAVGDLLIAILVGATTGTVFTPPGDWTPIAGKNGIQLYAHIMQTGETAYSFGYTPAGKAFGSIIDMGAVTVSPFVQLAANIADSKGNSLVRMTGLSDGDGFFTMTATLPLNTSITELVLNLLQTTGTQLPVSAIVLTAADYMR